MNLFLCDSPSCVLSRISYCATILVNKENSRIWRRCIMKRIKTLETKDLCASAKTGGCGECQTSCQSACKTSCGVANQQCEKTK